MTRQEQSPRQVVANDRGEGALVHALLHFDKPFHVACDGGLPTQVQAAGPGWLDGQAWCPPLHPSRLGSARFREVHRVRYAYQAGAMANGIASEELVERLARRGILSCYGSAGLPLPRVERAIAHLKQALPQGPYAFNLIHSPSEPALESGSVELFLRHGVHTVEASAFMRLTPSVVRYRATGLRRGPDGRVLAQNRIIAKVSRAEIAERFMELAPSDLLAELVKQHAITTAEAELAREVPVADDVTVEADSGGHTDNRPLITLLPSMLRLRDEVQRRREYVEPLRVGAGGGLGTPEAVMAAFAVGADYVVTGSVSQACVQAGTSERVRELPASAEETDFAMASAADMFELGVKLQVLKRGTLFPMRANRLYELYRTYDSLDAIPSAEREKLEAQYFRVDLDTIWEQCVSFFAQRDPSQLERARDDPKRKMALVFRWYLGMASRWAKDGSPERVSDYQVWAGPALGAFNRWARGTYLADYRRRDVAEVAEHLMRGAAFACRVQSLRRQGVVVPTSICYRPEPLTETSGD